MSKAMNLIKKTDKVMEWLTKIAAYVAAAALVFNMVIVVLYVISRTFNHAIIGVEEYVSFGQVIVIALGLGYTQFSKGLVHVGFFMKKLPKAGPMIAWVIDNYLAAVISVFWVIESVKHIPAVKQITQVLMAPQKPIYIAMTIGIIVYCIAQLYETFRVTVGIFDKDVRADVVEHWPA